MKLRKVGKRLLFFCEGLLCLKGDFIFIAGVIFMKKALENSGLDGLAIGNYLILR